MARHNPDLPIRTLKALIDPDRLWYEGQHYAEKQGTIDVAPLREVWGAAYKRGVHDALELIRRRHGLAIKGEVCPFCKHIVGSVPHLEICGV